MKDAIEVLKSRRSIRSYTQVTVPQGIIEDVVDCARMAPTAMNEQPWDFIAVTKRDLLRQIPPMLGHADFVAEAAFVVLVLGREVSYAVEDCCAATENLLIAAAAHGLGACWVAGTRLGYGPVVTEAFGAPADRQLVAIVSFGYPAEDPKVEKRPLADVLHWEKF
ncbi:MAG TPA: nitroreductase family protein [Terracidiphilus sp.]|nr:nitroreductase family protein [Terracidiphilus sp.]